MSLVRRRLKHRSQPSVVSAVVRKSPTSEVDKERCLAFGSDAVAKCRRAANSVVLPLQQREPSEALVSTKWSLDLERLHPKCLRVQKAAVPNLPVHSEQWGGAKAEQPAKPHTTSGPNNSR